MSRDLEILLESFWPIIRAGFEVTIPLSVLSFLFGIVIAIFTAVGKLSANKLINGAASFYVWIIRGTPLIVQLFIIFFGLPNVGIVLDPWVAGIIAFGLNFGAYASESIRGAILSVPRGQIEAAESLGMPAHQVFTRIVLPQAARVAIPALVGNFIALVKQTSLASTVTIMDMFLVAQRYVSFYYETMLIYIEVALIYLAITTILTKVQKNLEIRFSKYV